MATKTQRRSRTDWRNGKQGLRSLSFAWVKRESLALAGHSADPRLRSFIVNWLNPLGADPKAIVAVLDRIDPSIKPTPAEPPKAMDAILFHPETSQRRALILALGTYGAEGLSPDERQPFISKLLALYRNDPDSGIHGAAEWTLRNGGNRRSSRNWMPS